MDSLAEDVQKAGKPEVKKKDGEDGSKGEKRREIDRRVSNGGGGARDLHQMECYNCHRYGHTARDCGVARVQSPTSMWNPSAVRCYKCDRVGHLARECRTEAKIRCFICNHEGHRAAQCWESPQKQENWSGPNRGPWGRPVLEKGPKKMSLALQIPKRQSRYTMRMGEKQPYVVEESTSTDSSN